MKEIGKLVAYLLFLDKQIGKYTSKCCMEEFTNQVPRAREALGPKLRSLTKKVIQNCNVCER